MKVQVVVHIESAVIEVEEDTVKKYRDGDDDALFLVQTALEERLKQTDGPHIEYIEEL